MSALPRNYPSPNQVALEGILNLPHRNGRSYTQATRSVARRAAAPSASETWAGMFHKTGTIGTWCRQTWCRSAHLSGMMALHLGDKVVLCSGS